MNTIITGAAYKKRISSIKFSQILINVKVKRVLLAQNMRENNLRKKKKLVVIKYRESELCLNLII